MSDGQRDIQGTVRYEYLREAPDDVWPHLAQAMQRMLIGLYPKWKRIETNKVRRFRQLGTEPTLVAGNPEEDEWAVICGLAYYIGTMQLVENRHIANYAEQEQGLHLLAAGLRQSHLRRISEEIEIQDREHLSRRIVANVDTSKLSDSERQSLTDAERGLLWIPVLREPRVPTAHSDVRDSSGNRVPRMGGKTQRKLFGRGLAFLFRLYLDAAADQLPSDRLLRAMARRYEVRSQQVLNLVHHAIIKLCESGFPSRSDYEAWLAQLDELATRAIESPQRPADAAIRMRALAVVFETLCGQLAPVNYHALVEAHESNIAKLLPEEHELRVKPVIPVPVGPTDSGKAGTTAQSFWVLLERAFSSAFVVVGLNPSVRTESLSVVIPAMEFGTSTDISHRLSRKKYWHHYMRDGVRWGTQKFQKFMRRQYEFSYETSIPSAADSYHITVQVPEDLNAQDLLLTTRQDELHVAELRHDCVALSGWMNEISDPAELGPVHA